MKLKSFLKYSFLFLFSISCFFLEGKEPPSQPNPPKLVNDFAGVMNRAEVNGLERKLKAYNDSTSTQIAIVLEKSLEGDEIFDYSFRLAEKWSIGQQGKDNGILIYAAMDDRKIFIHVGPGLQGRVTDNLTKRIIENVIKPNFRNQRYYNGLERATSQIIEMASGEFKNDGRGQKRQTEFPFEVLIFIAVLILIVYMNKSDNDDEDDGGGYYRGGQYDYDRRRRKRSRGGGFIFFPGFGGGGGSGGGGGFGGGGFGGFGGGGFDGGGAGGSW